MMSLLLPNQLRQSSKPVSDTYKNSAIVQKWVPYWQRYLFNAIPDINHNANPTNHNHYSKGNPNPTNPTNPNTRYRCE